MASCFLHEIAGIKHAPAHFVRSHSSSEISLQDLNEESQSVFNTAVMVSSVCVRVFPVFWRAGSVIVPDVIFRLSESGVSFLSAFFLLQHNLKV